MTAGEVRSLRQQYRSLPHDYRGRPQQAPELRLAVSHRLRVVQLRYLVRKP